MTIRFEIPESIESLLTEFGADASSAAKEATLVELVRRGRLTTGALATALGVSRYEADGILKRYGVALEITSDQLQADIVAREWKGR